MALLLDEKTRNEYLAELGFTDWKSFQKKYLYARYVDGVYGKNTENALLTAIHCKRYAPNFNALEFRCECGGKYCSGYPSYMTPEIIKNIQAIRNHWSKPVTVTCGLRDKTYNSKLGGSIQNSLHIHGRAIDFYQSGTTDTLANRKKAIKWIKKQSFHHYTYGNGINSYGNGISAPYMGNALHTDVYENNPKKETATGKLTVDGVGGKATVKALQKYFGTTQDGVITGQSKAMSKYYPSLKSVKYGKGGSECVRKIQKLCGTATDGIWGKDTSKGLQYKLGVTADGVFGTNSMKALQKFLNGDLTLRGGTLIPNIGDKVTTSSSAVVSAVAKATNKKVNPIATKAFAYAYQSNTGNAAYPKGKPKEAYKKALYKAYPNLKGGKSAAAHGASCDVFVGVCVRMAGIDKNFPRGLCPDYMAKSKKFKQVKKSDIKDGDIIINNKHVCIAYGGKIKEASNGDFYPKTTNTLKKRLNAKGVKVYRPKGY